LGGIISVGITSAAGACEARGTPSGYEARNAAGALVVRVCISRTVDLSPSLIEQESLADGCTEPLSALTPSRCRQLNQAAVGG